MLIPRIVRISCPRATPFIMVHPFVSQIYHFLKVGYELNAIGVASLFNDLQRLAFGAFTRSPILPHAPAEPNHRAMMHARDA